MQQCTNRKTSRLLKYRSRGYTHAQIKVCEATCNDPDADISETQLNEIIHMAFDRYAFDEVAWVFDMRLKGYGSRWLHAFKSLAVLAYCLDVGSDNVIAYLQNRYQLLETLRNFQYIDEDGRDRGASVRQKAEEVLRALRALSGPDDRTRVADHADSIVQPVASGSRPARPNFSSRPAQSNRRASLDDAELRYAIEESRMTAQTDQVSPEERDLMEAIRLSNEDEARRQEAITQANSEALFDDLAWQSKISVFAANPAVDIYNHPPHIQAPFQPLVIPTTVHPQDIYSLPPQYAQPRAPLYDMPKAPQYSLLNPFRELAQQEQMRFLHAKNQWHSPVLHQHAPTQAQLHQQWSGTPPHMLTKSISLPDPSHSVAGDTNDAAERRLLILRDVVDAELVQLRARPLPAGRESHSPTAEMPPPYEPM